MRYISLHNCEVKTKFAKGAKFLSDNRPAALQCLLHIMAANTPSLIEFGELPQVQQTVANSDRTRKFPFSGVQWNFLHQIVSFNAIIIIDAELSQVRNPFVQKISIKKIMDQDDNQLERFDNMYVLVGVNKISLMKYFTI